ncbi:hypothetical protein BgiBS90_019153, partial [Biomphalaria glabrata]
CLFACSKTELGKPFTFSAPFTHSLPDDLDVVWNFNNETRSQCSAKFGCLDNNEEKTLTTLRNISSSNRYECELRITNVTHGDVGKWTLNYLGSAGLVHEDSLFSCDLKVS